MKSKFILLAFILLSVKAFSQSKTTISLVYGIAASDIITYGSIGDFGYNSKTGTTYGLNYSRNINHLWSFETGLFYADNKVQKTSVLPGAVSIRNGDIKLISVPAIAKIGFLTYLYADIGLTFDFQTNYTNNSNSIAPDQSGIGVEGGIGGKYNFGSVTVFINPFLQRHSAIHFNSDGSNFNLLNSGVKFGVGYGF